MPGTTALLDPPNCDEVYVTQTQLPRPLASSCVAHKQLSHTVEEQRRLPHNESLHVLGVPDVLVTLGI